MNVADQYLADLSLEELEQTREELRTCKPTVEIKNLLKRIEARIELLGEKP